jgi:hypothetical protein
MTTSAQQAELEKPVTRVAYFVELHFATHTARFCTFNQSFEWGGNTWVGLGSLASISAVEESDGLEARSLTFGMNAADTSLLALAAGDVEEYRGRSAKMYFCPLDENFRLIDSPELCWRGSMDSVSVDLNGDAGQVMLKCETSAYGLKRTSGLRMNAAQHAKRHPGDTGFDFLTDLIANPQLWLSKKFQRI